MESERKIEKLLRAYAKKRRAQAGDPLKLHPAMRRQLLDEVARNARKPEDEDASMTLWELFRQRWAFLLAFSLMIFLAASLFLPALSSAKKKAQNVTAMNNLKEIGVAAQMAAEENNGKLPASFDALTNQLGSDKILTDTESGKRFVYIAAGENLKDLPGNSVLAYSPMDKKGRVVLFANGSVAVINDAQFSELTNHGSPELVAASDSMSPTLAVTPASISGLGGNAAAMPAISGQVKSDGNRDESKLTAPGTTFDRRTTAQTKSVEFGSDASRRLVFGLQNSFKNIAAPSRSVSVLANFSVQQNGSAIRVVDADGSVYEGSLQPENAVARNGPAQTATLAPPAGQPAQIEREKIIANQDEPQTAQSYFFRVAGTSQTLRQNVVFAGNLQAISSSTTNLQQSLSRGGGGGLDESQLQSVFTNQLPWSNSRITGTAVIAETNNIEINALPQSN